MKMISLILALGVVLLVGFKTACAQYEAYTVQGHCAATNLFYLDDLTRFVHEGDKAAIDEMISKGEAVCFKGGDKVLFEKESSFGTYVVKFHFTGSSIMLWCQSLWLACDIPSMCSHLVERPESVKKSAPTGVRSVHLKSISSIKVGKTTRQELLKRYGKPDKADESFGEYTYFTASSNIQDFKGYDFVTFQFDGNVLEDIKAGASMD